MSTALRRATSLKEFYEICLSTQTAITPHLHTLRHYASRGETAAEFGVKRGFSSSALLMGASRVYSWDIAPTMEAQHLQRLVPDRWFYNIGDSREAELPNVDTLFIDSLHVYEQVRDELKLADSRVKSYLIFHDHGTFGSVGADGETGRQKWAYKVGESTPLDCLGIMQAILEFMAQTDGRWQVVESNPCSHGLLVLKRRS